MSFVIEVPALQSPRGRLSLPEANSNGKSKNTHVEPVYTVPYFGYSSSIPTPDPGDIVDGLELPKSSHANVPSLSAAKIESPRLVSLSRTGTPFPEEVRSDLGGSVSIASEKQRKKKAGKISLGKSPQITKLGAFRHPWNTHLTAADPASSWFARKSEQSESEASASWNDASSHWEGMCTSDRESGTLDPSDTGSTSEVARPTTKNKNKKGKKTKAVKKIQSSEKQPVKLKLGLNLKLDIELKAEIEGDITISLVAETTPTPRSSPRIHLDPDHEGCSTLENVGHELFFLRVGTIRFYQRWQDQRVSPFLTGLVILVLLVMGFVVGFLARGALAVKGVCGSDGDMFMMPSPVGIHQYD
ncbi:hypothetical protein BROUX41_000595 [Berkeleyomyces rouxiae]|uniref:uncharacterized protein n=1 Tax=Berkeleyomyces rouxiae TaxID=2035830 RepID=UPI003B7A5FD5